MFIGRTDAKAETPVLWPPHVKRWLIGKDSDAGRDWGQEEKGTTEDEMAGWHHWLDGRESEWTPGVGDGQGGLACRDSWGRKESDMTERLNWTELNNDLCLLVLTLKEGRSLFAIPRAKLICHSKSSRSWWWTGKPGVPQSMGSQRVGHNWATELDWTTHGLSLPKKKIFQLFYKLVYLYIWNGEYLVGKQSSWDTVFIT